MIIEVNYLKKNHINRNIVELQSHQRTDVHTKKDRLRLQVRTMSNFLKDICV